MKSIPRHKACRMASISVYLFLSQALVYTAIQQIRG